MYFLFLTWIPPRQSTLLLSYWLLGHGPNFPLFGCRLLHEQWVLLIQFFWLRSRPMPLHFGHPLLFVLCSFLRLGLAQLYDLHLQLFQHLFILPQFGIVDRILNRFFVFVLEVLQLATESIFALGECIKLVGYFCKFGCLGTRNFFPLLVSLNYLHKCLWPKSLDITK